MTSTAATCTSHDQQPGRSDMDDHQRGEYLRTACSATDQEWRAASEAAHRPPPEDPDAARQRARDTALEALTGAGLYRAQVSSIWWHPPGGGHTMTWAPAPAGCSLTPAGTGRVASTPPTGGGGPTMQRTLDEVRAQPGPGHHQPAAISTREAPGPARGSDRLYRVVQYYDSWPFGNDSRIPHGSKSHRRTDTLRTLGPVKDRLARTSGPTALPGTSAATAGTGQRSPPSPSS